MHEFQSSQEETEGEGGPNKERPTMDGEGGPNKRRGLHRTTFLRGTGQRSGRGGEHNSMITYFQINWNIMVPEWQITSSKVI